MQGVLLFLWIAEIVGLAMLIQEFTLKMTDVRPSKCAPLTVGGDVCFCPLVLERGMLVNRGMTCMSLE